MLQNRLSEVGQTVTFDHAGSGWSSETEAERSIENLVKELSILIDTSVPDKSMYYQFTGNSYTYFFL